MWAHYKGYFGILPPSPTNQKCGGGEEMVGLTIVSERVTDKLLYIQSLATIVAGPQYGFGETEI